jgi:glutathione peroxidase
LYDHLKSERAEGDITDGDEFEVKLKGYGQSREIPEDILWNFEKFLVGRDGKVLARIASDVTVEDERVVAAVNNAIGD